MSNGFKDALVGFFYPPASSAATRVIPGLDDATEEIELLSPEEWQMLNNELYGNKRPWWDPACECGSEKTYGVGTRLHSSWCPRNGK